MTTLFDQQGVDRIMNRANNLNDTNVAQWGKMKVGQMVAHVRIAMDAATGEHHLPAGNFILKLIGPMILKGILSDKPLKKNSPTAPSFRMTGEHNLEKEKQQLQHTLNRFSQLGRNGQLPARHPIFGKMSHNDWDHFYQKHFDHHFTQFGV